MKYKTTSLSFFFIIIINFVFFPGICRADSFTYTLTHDSFNRTTSISIKNTDEEISDTSDFKYRKNGQLTTITLKGTGDTDQDGHHNTQDAFPDDPNEWLDTDQDGIGNNADPDDDGDKMPDTWEEQYHLDPLDFTDAGQDADEDGISNYKEYLDGTLPDDPNSFDPSNFEVAIPYENDFNLSHGGFKAYALSEDTLEWEWGQCNSENFNGDYATIEGTGSWATRLDDSHGLQTRYALEVPSFSIPDGNDDFYIEFRFSAFCGSGAGMNMEFSIDGGASWTLLGAVDDANGEEWYNETTIEGLDGQPGWSYASLLVHSPKFNINFLRNQDDVRLRFVFGAADYQQDGIVMDNFKIIQEPVFAPEINIKGNNTTIINGDTTPSTEDFTDFGDVENVQETITKSFIIENTGDMDLILNGTPVIDITGANASDFSVSTEPATTVLAGNNTSFQLTFAPDITAPAKRMATVNISSNDEDEPIYSFAIQGNIFLLGNVNGDNNIDLQDVILTLQVLAGQNPSGISYNDVITLRDAIYALQLISEVQ